MERRMYDRQISKQGMSDGCGCRGGGGGTMERRMYDRQISKQGMSDGCGCRGGGGGGGTMERRIYYAGVSCSDCINN